MKLRRSLKIFLICVMMAMASITVVSFSHLAANYFEQGLDGGMRMMMMDIGREVALTGQKPEMMMGFHVAHHWQAIPSDIAALFEPLEQSMQFTKYIENQHWFSAPERAVFLMRYDQTAGDPLYIYRVLDDVQRPELIQNRPRGEIPHFVKLVSYAVLGIGLFGLCMYFLVQRVAKPVERLALWAKQLTPEQLVIPAPDFHYNELNRLAEVVKNSLVSVDSALRREQKFLAHASHELRTPIAVVRSNSELLMKLLEKQSAPEKRQQVLERILRAGVTMSDLCETLLWLNRGKETELPLVEVDLGSSIEQICQELSYLLDNKKVQLEVNIHYQSYRLPATLYRIVLSNLIRNAYQHTQCGKVVIRQEGAQVLISNREDSRPKKTEDLGFGLGLELTNRIIKQYHWRCETVKYLHGRDVTIHFLKP
ncbi:sensor histidine kinase [Vibrio cincinnatiensis]|uniref:sensor histidine kinase n=1 Tax=Vibrio cincinnatiensis TaxID=675 RepID=UPI001EDE7A10|nr:HAMP domain-containing sensor histidine kinase [Vibrio cincinnatiensis]MCG3729753.1 HAMP domain-containing histidine kinase [Vibrio cincinnatiensis]